MKKEVKVGLTIVAGIVLLYLLVTWVKNMHLFAVSQSGYDIRFQDVSGLKEGDPVTVYGYSSGHVESIRIDGTGAIVHISLSEDIAVQTDASASLRVKEIMGGKAIELHPGASGHKLPMDHPIPGTTSLDFSSAFEKTGDFMDRFDMNRIDSMMGDVERLLNTFSRVADALDTVDTKGMLGDLQSSAGTMNRLLSEVEQRQLVADIDRSLGRVEQLAGKAETSLGAIDKLTMQLNDRTLPLADSMMRDVNKLLGDSEGMIGDLKKILKQFQDRSTLAGQLLYDPEFAKQVDGSLKNLDKTLDHIRTKKIYVTMTLAKGQKVFSEEAVDTVDRR